MSLWNRIISFFFMQLFSDKWYFEWQLYHIDVSADYVVHRVVLCLHQDCKEGIWCYYVKRFDTNWLMRLTRKCFVPNRTPTWSFLRQQRAKLAIRPNICLCHRLWRERNFIIQIKENKTEKEFDFHLLPERARWFWNQIFTDESGRRSCCASCSCSITVG